MGETADDPKKRAIPSFFDLNPLKSNEPPKEMFGKSLEKVWKIFGGGRS
jgi:hypothetical protein